MLSLPVLYTSVTAANITSPRPTNPSLTPCPSGGKCDVCDKYIPHRLKRHLASHVQHPCPICKKLFSREDVIAGHIKVRGRGSEGRGVLC